MKIYLNNNSDKILIGECNENQEAFSKIREHSKQMGHKIYTFSFTKKENITYVNVGGDIGFYSIHTGK